MVYSRFRFKHHNSPPACISLMGWKVFDNPFKFFALMLPSVT